MLTLCLLLKQDRYVYTSQQYEQGIHGITTENVKVVTKCMCQTSYDVYTVCNLFMLLIETW
jgi:hypothetical protein